ncbi:putative tyrosine phosphatase [Trypanosoma cruzi]|uniref:Phosphatidylinositol 3,4,5-trisphosphate 3-phosphatase and dual-specificity protein phosphatase PTEN n=1 Tax=Trypanosoma cruzi TaxID=5693 RepID=A0A2V2WRC9_TRYCR|nr:putative tyrosine phosphatase [Trypanosoma cruzi]
MASLNAHAGGNVEWGSYVARCPVCAMGPCTGTCLKVPNEGTCGKEGNTSAPNGSTCVLPELCLNDLNKLLGEEFNETDVHHDEGNEVIQEYTKMKNTASETCLSTTMMCIRGAREMEEELGAAKKQLEDLMLDQVEFFSHSLENVGNGINTAAGQIDLNIIDEILSEDSFDSDDAVFFRVAEEDPVPKPTEIGSSLAVLVSQNSALAMMRSKVSQLKRRYKMDGFDLDLTYITPRLIAMGFPAWGTEKYYRNPIDQVELFLESKHGGHYRIYNLCSERPEYDSPKRFQGKFKRFPFDDHNAPCPISLVIDFIRDATSFLEEDAKNVVVVHCKAGKGRTGVMVSCLLRSLDPIGIPDAKEALRVFGNARTYNGLGVTIPSQCRYVYYYDRIVRDFGGQLPPSRPIKLYQIIVDSSIKSCGQVDVYFTVEENGVMKIDSRHLFHGGLKRDPKGFFFLFEEEPTLQGDLRFTFHQRHRLFNEELFYFWINTSLCSNYERFSLKDRELDGRLSKGKDGDTFCKDLAVNVIFVD